MTIQPSDVLERAVINFHAPKRDKVMAILLAGRTVTIDDVARAVFGDGPHDRLARQKASQIIRRIPMFLKPGWTLLKVRRGEWRLINESDSL